MEFDGLRRVIEDQRESYRKLLSGHIIARELDRKKAVSALAKPNVLAVLGVRRSGKSTLALTLFKEEPAHVNFDDEALYGLRAADLNDVLKALYMTYGRDRIILLDEIQNVPGWELFVARIRDTERVIITGSNAVLLGSELATHLTGRHIDMVLFPFSFREFLEYKGIKIDHRSHSTAASMASEPAAEEYINAGGFPEAYILGKDIVSSIYNDIITKDVVKRHKIRDIAALLSLSNFLVSNFSKEITYGSMTGSFGIKNISTVRKYVAYLEEAYLVFQLERFSKNLKRKALAPRKIYAIDTGVIGVVFPGAWDNKGRLMENVVATELMRRKAYWKHFTDLYYWKDHQQREVDFVVVKEGNAVQLIQVSYSVADPETRSRETSALLRAAAELGCNSLVCITWNYEAIEDAEGKMIRYVPLWRWLLSNAEGLL